MKYAVLTAVLLAASGLVLAQDPPDQSGERLRRLERDFPLVEALVREGLQLADEENPLKRAQTCNVLAEVLVSQITLAAGQRQEQRAADMGNYLQAVLVRGVAGNLDVARSRLPGDAEPELQQIREEMLRITEPVTLLRSQATEQRIMQPAIDAVTRGRHAVQKAVTSHRDK